MALRCGLIGNVEVFGRFRNFPQVDLGHQFGDGAWPVCRVCRAVRPHGCCPVRFDPGSPQLWIMADALSGTMTGARLWLPDRGLQAARADRLFLFT